MSCGILIRLIRVNGSFGIEAYLFFRQAKLSAPPSRRLRWDSSFPTPRRTRPYKPLVSVTGGCPLRACCRAPEMVEAVSVRSGNVSVVWTIWQRGWIRGCRASKRPLRQAWRRGLPVLFRERLWGRSNPPDDTCPMHVGNL
jgi:hypothetical protein